MYNLIYSWHILKFGNENRDIEFDAYAKDFFDMFSVSEFTVKF